MNGKNFRNISVLLILILLWGASEGYCAINPQFYPDDDPNDTDGDGNAFNDNVYMHLTAGDGFINMADGKLQYIFGFSDVTGVSNDMVMETGTLAANFPAPSIVVKEGQKLFLNLSNVGMMMRPDLFDAHTVHWHGFPNAAPVFDGVPDSSISIIMGSTFTYFYNVVEPGTYVYHCHFEATEHMEMGMLGNLWVTPIQNELFGGTYVYNDGDGSTEYDVEYPLQFSGFDTFFHDEHLGVQPLPFALLKTDYPMINGRGYPQTIDTNELYNTAFTELGVGDADRPSRKINSLITATQGQKILLRLSNLSVVDYFTITTTMGVPMRIVGTGARMLRSPAGLDTSYTTSSVTLGGGETIEAIIDTTDVAPGTYFLYTTNLNFLSNDNEDYGGIMTEIVISG